MNGGTASGAAASAVHSGRAGRSVRSMNHASAVPSSVHASVAASVIDNVLTSSSPTSGRHSSSIASSTPKVAARYSVKPSGSRIASGPHAAAATSARDGRRLVAVGPPSRAVLAVRDTASLMVRAGLLSAAACRPGCRRRAARTTVPAGQFVERLQDRIGRDARMQRILEADMAAGHQFLRALADEIRDELLRFRLALRDLQHRGAGHVDGPADVAFAEVVDRAAGRLVAGFGVQAVPVVVVDDAGQHAAAVDGRRHAFVVVEDLRVGLQALQPLQRRGFAVQREHRAHERQEVCVARRDADLALPFRLREIEQRGGQLLRLDFRGVVDEHVLAREHADPVAVGRVEARGHRLQRGGVGLREQALAVEQHGFRRVLGEVHVGRRAVAFRDELRGECRAFARAHLHGDAALCFEVLDELVDDLLVLRVVQRERRGMRARGVQRAGQHQRGGRRGNQVPQRAANR